MPKSTWIDSCTCLCRESKQASTLFFLAATWLVIAGAYAKYKGVGTINGEGIMINATDGVLLRGGKADEFRIRIWDANGLYYDNKMGEPDDSYAGTEIGGGNIRICKK